MFSCGRRRLISKPKVRRAHPIYERRFRAGELLSRSKTQIVVIPGQRTQCAPEDAPHAPLCLPLPVGLLDFCPTQDGPSQWGVVDIHAKHKAPDSREGVQSQRATIVFRSLHLLRLEQRYAPEEFLPSQPLVFQGELCIVFEKLLNSTIMKIQHLTRC